MFWKCYFHLVHIHPFPPLKVSGKIGGLAAMVQDPTNYANVIIAQNPSNTIKEAMHTKIASLYTGLV